MHYHIISVGSELTLGLSVNTNAPYIAKRLGREGFTANRHVSVPDNREAIVEAILEGLKQADGVIITGGLGPTLDDITREAISDATGRELEYQPHLAQVIEDRFGARAMQLPKIAYRQAYLPASAEAIEPTIGSAPGILLEDDGGFIVSLPGVPREMEAMLEEKVIPWLHSKFCCREAHMVRVLRTTARTEASLQEAVEDIIDSLENITVGILAFPGEIQLQLHAKGPDVASVERAIRGAEKAFVERLGNIVFGFDDETLEEVIGNLLRDNHLTLALAESCTGGLTAKKITDIPGSSDYFFGGVVAYNNDAKVALLGVQKETIESFGAVSPETALEMAIGARDRLDSDIGIGITGIAGPTGETPDKPVGLVYIGLSHGDSHFSKRFVFFGSRDIVRLKSANAALDILRYHILDTVMAAEGELA